MSDMIGDVIISCDNLVKIYAMDDIKVMALQGLDIEIKRGEMVTVLGKSGSGKSTLLNIIGGLENPTAGTIFVDGRELSKMDVDDLEKFRRETVGFVWQKSSENLFEYMTVLDNVQAVMNFTKGSKKEKKERAKSLLQDVGMDKHMNKFPSQLSGGEQQRVAIAVALANNPTILLADEPTSAVDSKTAGQILKLLYKLNREKNITILIVTHDVELADKVNRTVMIADGKVSTERHRTKDFDIDYSKADFTYKDVREENIHETFSVLDKANRLKLDDEVLESVGITSNKVKVEVVDGKIVISRD